MSKILFKNATIVNEGASQKGNILVEGEIISKMFAQDDEPADEIIDCSGLHLIPGMIDDQVHFREPGLTHKANIQTESIAAVAGGITSFMEMPNTVPNTLTQELLQEKYDRAEETSSANYSFFMGASNDNLDEVLKTNEKEVCGVKVFMGSSTGNMLVDNRTTLEGLFKECPMLIATHCEDEATIRANMAAAIEKYGDNIPIGLHPEIRNAEACYKSSSMAVELAHKYNTRLHVLHISTAKELELFSNDPITKSKNVTAEACIHHLWFVEADYNQKKTFIKWNPAVKSESDRAGLRAALLDGTIDVIATDHAPHTLEEKLNPYTKAPSGGPLVQHAVVGMLELTKQGVLSIERAVELMSHNVAKCFEIEKRGYLKEGYFADMVLVDLNAPWRPSKENILYKCGWSPFEGEMFSSKIAGTWVNGTHVYDGVQVTGKKNSKRLRFDR